MREVVCSQCQATVSVPDDLARPHCVRCGGALELETNITAEAPRGRSSFQPEPYVARPPGESKPIELPERYASWEEFRSTSPAVQRELLAFVARPLPDLRRAELQELPSNASELGAELGLPLATLTKPGENVLAHTIGGIAFMAAWLGCVVMLMIELLNSPQKRGQDVFGVIMMIVCLIAMAFLGAWYAFLRTPSYGITCWIFENGLLGQCGNRINAFSWEDVTELQVNLERGHPIFWLTLWPGKKISFSPRLGPAVVPLLEYLEIKVVAAKFLPTLRQIFEGERVVFGAVSLDLNGLSGPRYYAAWSEITRVVNDPVSVFVEQQGQVAWHAIRYREIAFPLLVLAVSHVMIDEHQRIPSAG